MNVRFFISVALWLSTIFVLAVDARIALAEDADRLVELAKRMSIHDERPATSGTQPDTSAASTKENDTTSAVEEISLSRSPKESLPLGFSGDAKRDVGKQSGEESGGGWMLNTFTALGLVLLLIWGLRSLLLKASGRPVASSVNPTVQVLSRVSIAPRNHVVLLKLGQRVLVVGDSTAGLQPIAEITEPDEIADILTTVASSKPNSISQSFSQLLNRANNDYEGESDIATEGADDHEFTIDRARDRVSGLLSRMRSLTKRGEA